MDIIVEVEKKVLVNIDGGRGPQGTQGIDGENGENIELQNSGSFIQWRVVGDVSWTNLIAVADLQGNDGNDGREIELQNTGTFIQWRYVGESWTNLISIASITGPQGPKGDTGDQGPQGIQGIQGETGPAGTTDHGLLIGLGDDDHTQYMLLSGRVGGQTLIGGTAASENITLSSTSNATKGSIIFGDSRYNEATNRLSFGTASGMGRINLPDGGTTASDGIAFGNVTLYRSASSILTMGSTAGLGIITFEPNSGGGRINGNVNGEMNIRPAFDLRINSANGGGLIIATSTTILTPLTLTGSSATSALSISQTWNTTGTPTAIDLNLTDTASNAASLFFNCRRNGSSVFSIGKTGNVNISGEVTSTAYFGFSQQRLRLTNGGATTFGIIKGNGTGIIVLSDATEANINRVNYGGSNSTFPAHKRVGATIETRLADDSDFAATQSLYQRFGTGSPEGVVTAPVGAVYHRTDGGAGTSFYVKQSGTGNTGWVAK